MQELETNPSIYGEKPGLVIIEEGNQLKERINYIVFYGYLALTGQDLALISLDDSQK